MKIQVRGYLAAKSAIVLAVASLHMGCTMFSGDEETDEPVDETSAEEAESPSTPVAAEAPPAAPVSEAPRSEPAAAPQTSPADSASAPSASVASSNRRVMYAKSDGVKVYDSPSLQGKVLTKLEKGDHLLVEVEGDWAKTQDGRYIAVNTLSSKGVGRNKKAGAWSPPNVNSVPQQKARAKTPPPAAEKAKDTQPAAADPEQAKESAIPAE